MGQHNHQNELQTKREKIMGLFSNIKDARGTQGGVYFEPGLFEVQVDRVKTGKTRKGDDFYVVECTILESSNEERPVGSTCSWMALFKHDATLGNIADFSRAGLFSLATQNDLDPGVASYQQVEVDDESAQNICSEENPLAGVRLKVEATNIKTKANRDFTKLTWKPAA